MTIYENKEVSGRLPWAGGEQIFSYVEAVSILMAF